MSILKYRVDFIIKGQYGDDIYDLIDCHNLLKAVKIAYNLIQQQGYDHVYIKIYKE